MHRLDRFWKAERLAHRHHKGQMYGNKPYMYHLKGVFNLANLEYPEGSTSVLVVSLLHDILEDTDISEEELKEVVTEEEYEAILAVSKKPDEKYVNYLERVSKNEIASKVKAVDILFNMNHSLKEGNNKRASYYMDKYAKLKKLSNYLRSES